MISRRVLLNGIITPDGTELISRHVHDYRSHKDKNGNYYSVDGGSWYIRRGYDVKDYKDISVMDDGLHETRRNNLSWGSTLDKRGNRLKLVEWKFIKDLDTDHIYNILQIEGIDKFYRQVLEDEICWRTGDINF